MLDLYENETDQALARLPGTKVPEGGVFDGFVRGAGMAAVRTGIKTLVRPAAMAASIGAIAYDKDLQIAYGDKFTDGTDARDKYFKSMDEIFDSAIDYWTPKPAEVGVAGEVVGQLLGLLPIVIASPAAAVAGTYMDTATELAKKGVGDWRAQAVGAAQAAGLGAGIWMPILGANLWQRVLAGGAGFNVLQGITMRGASELILKDHPAAEEFKALDGTALTLDVLLGMAFGGITHLSPAQRAQGAKAWERIRSWAVDLEPTQKAAVAVLRDAQHLNQDSLAGKPAAPEDIDAHTQRAKVALEQVVRGEPVAVETMPAPRLEADPARWTEAEKRTKALQEEGAALERAYSMVLAEPVGPVNDPLVRLTTDELGDIFVQRGEAVMKDGELVVNKSRHGLVKIIWKHGEKSTAPDELKITKEDVLRLPEVVRDFAPIQDVTLPDGKRLIEWQVEREDGKRVIYSTRKFTATDNKQQVVTIMVNKDLTDGMRGKPISEKTNRLAESSTAEFMSGVRDTGPQPLLSSAGGQEGGSPANTGPEGPAGQPRAAEPPPGNRGEKPAGPEAEKVDPVAREADRFAGERPDLPIRTGTTPEGDAVVKPLKEFLGDARAEVEQARQDATLFEAAAACMLGVS